MKDATPDRPKTASRNLNLGCLILFGLPFIGAGATALVQGINKLDGGDLRRALPMIMGGLLFLSVGLGCAALGFFGSRARKKTLQTRALRPDSPWHWRDDWARKEIAPQQKHAATFMWVFALFWNGISWTVMVAFLADGKVHSREPVSYIIWLFPFIGLCLLYAAVVMTLRSRRFGNARFRISNLPTSPGDSLDGVIELPCKLPPGAPVFLRLTCARIEVSGSGKNRRTSSETLWQNEFALRPGLPAFKPNRTAIPVYFALPSNQPPTSGEGGDGSIRWTLNASAAFGGPNLDLDFELPIFPGGTCLQKTAEDRTAPYRMTPEELRQAIKSKITVEPAHDGGLDFKFPRMMNPGSVLFLLAWVIGWGGVTFLLFKFGAPLIFRIILGVVLAFSVYGLFTGFLRATRIHAGQGKIIRTNDWLLFSRRTEIPLRDVQELSCAVTSSSGKTSYYSLKARLSSGRNVSLAHGISSAAEAEWLLQELRCSTGVRAADMSHSAKLKD